jgi:hypothetical protein
MKVIQKRIHAISAVFIVITMLVCSSVVPRQAWAEDDSTPPVIRQSRFDAAVQKEMTVSQKTPKDILADKERFFVTPATVIMNEDGEQIILENLLVPCRANVYYEIKKMRSSKALKIEVKEVYAGASTAWSPGAPE